MASKGLVALPLKVRIPLVGEDRRTPEMVRYTVAEAADMLGDLHRSRSQPPVAGTLPSTKESGTVYVLLAADLERIPAIEAPQETSEAAETVDEQQGRGREPHSDAPGAPDAVQRPWWRRVFGRGR
jgi:hypothetical protein